MLHSFSDASGAVERAFVEAFRRDERWMMISSSPVDALYRTISREFPERSLAVDGEERSVVLTAAGLALEGFLSMVGPGSPRLVTRGYDEIRSAVALPSLPVLLLGSGGGLFRGDLGAPDQVVEDLALMRALPGMRVFFPSDALVLAEILAGPHDGPAYLRWEPWGGDPSGPGGTSPREDLLAGGRIRRPGSAVTICTYGALVREALRAAEILSSQGIDAEVIECLSFKPLPENLILASGRRTGCGVVAEEHVTEGGLGSAVAELMGRCYPIPVLSVSLEGHFGQSGTEAELREYYALTRQHMVGAAVQAWSMRRGG